jgi:hypothetical protein
MYAIRPGTGIGTRPRLQARSEGGDARITNGSVTARWPAPRLLIALSRT